MKKKICYLINTDWYFELHWLERALAARDNGYEVHVITHFANNNICRRITSAGLLCYNIPLSAQSYNPFLMVRSYFQVRKLLNKLNPDILHCITIKASLIGGLYSKPANKKIVLSFVGLGRVFSFDRLPFRWLRNGVVCFYKYIFKNENIRLLFEHENDRLDLVKYTNVEINKTLVINGAGVNTELFNCTKEKTNDVPVILFASRLLWSKGLDDLIRVRESLIKEGIPCRIDVAGILTDKDADAIPLSKIKKWHAEGKINWLGQSDNVAALIANANLVVLPSVYPEGIPRILLEASASGRACIAYDSGGCACLIKNGVNGYLVAKKDILSLKEHIKYLLVNPLIRSEMGKKGRALILEEFSSELVTKKTLELYNNLILCKN